MKREIVEAPARYMLLDGLRGVAAMVVLCYHIGEGFAVSPDTQAVNHGYLAVDFFFMLSGFVIGTAYDGRWQKKMTVKDFFRRRLIRLHPMLLLGALIGFAAFAFQGFVRWDGSSVDLHWSLLALVLTALFIPAYPGAPHEVRGNGELFPLNGPAWSLFFEYIGNILYALLLRRLSTPVLSAVCAFSGIGLVFFALGNYSGSWHIGAGWTFADYNFLGGMLRLGFSFSAGLLMSRLYRPRKIRNAFWICTVCIVVLLSMPFVGDMNDGTGWWNGLYDTLCVVLAFPMVLFVGASGDIGGRRSAVFCDWLGRLSYPVYIVHYPLMYLFYAWVWSEGLSFGQCWHVAVGVVVSSVVLAYLCLKYYDEPVREMLSGKRPVPFFGKKTSLG